MTNALEERISEEIESAIRSDSEAVHGHLDQS